MKTILLGILIIGFFEGCNKENDKACWQGWDIGGADALGILLCDKIKSEAEAEAQYPGYWFYRQGETKYCWRSVSGNQTFYWINMPESIKDKYVAGGVMGAFAKIECNSFCSCEWNEKHRSKLTGLYNPTKRITEVLFSSDSCTKITVGQIIIYRETSDSLITRELFKKQP